MINGRGGGEGQSEGRGRKREGDAEIGTGGRKREGGGERPGKLSEVSLTSSSRQPGSPFSQLRHILLSPPPPPSEAALLPTGRNIGRVNLNWPKKNLSGQTLK
jgi:hypothetical protein